MPSFEAMELGFISAICIFYKCAWKMKTRCVSQSGLAIPIYIYIVLSMNMNEKMTLFEEEEN